MSAAPNATIASPADPPRLLRRPARKSALTRAILPFYVAFLGGIAIHLYRKPVYSMDSIQYMGNALLMQERDPVLIHRRVYTEIQRFVPRVEREGLLGYEPGAPEDLNKSRQERATNAARFAEFLPLFAIRPLYNQTLWLVSRMGLGLVRAGIFISVLSYFCLGLLTFVWLGRYVSRGITLAFSILLMISSPLMTLGRETTADALATLVAFAALYLIFEKRKLLPGMTLLLASIYFRTDFVVLAGSVILLCWLEKRLELWKAGVLSVVAAASVLCINHFSGDYGVGMLYYRNFTGVPVAPGEMTVHLSLSGYLSAFRAGITLMMESFFLPFLSLGAVGIVSRRMRGLFAVTLAYVSLHFLVLPNWQERWFGVFYLCMGVCAATTVGAVQQGVTRSPRAIE